MEKSFWKTSLAENPDKKEAYDPITVFCKFA